MPSAFAMLSYPRQRVPIPPLALAAERLAQDNYQPAQVTCTGALRSEVRVRSYACDVETFNSVCKCTFNDEIELQLCLSVCKCTFCLSVRRQPIKQNKRVFHPFFLSLRNPLRLNIKVKSKKKSAALFLGTIR